MPSTPPRLSLGRAALVALAPLACTRPAPAVLPAPTVATAAAQPSPPAVVVTPPSERPAGFDVDTAALDVDGDGLVDRVRAIPAIERAGATPIVFSDLPPALVAHRLADGRYAVDDDLTRAALRALCPEAPPARLVVDATPSESDSATERRARLLLLDALCARAWGRSHDDVAAALRATLTTTADAGAPLVPAGLVEATVRALAPLTFAFVLRPLDVPFPSTGPFVPAPAAPTAAPTAAPAVVAPACRAVTAANQRVWTAAIRAGTLLAARTPPSPDEAVAATPPTALPDAARCLPVAGGAWSLRFASLEYRATDEGLRGPVQLAFAGAPTAGRWAPAAIAEPWQEGTFRSTTYSLDRAFDWDHDGRPEVVLRTNTWEHEGPSASTLAIYGARGGAVVAYAPAADFNGSIVALEDADRDGRDDLVLPTAWRFVDGCGMNGIEHEGPRLLAHALPDGSFSTTDDVARRWVTGACEQMPTPGDAARQYEDRDVWRVACARALGASPEHIVAALRADHPDRPRLQPGDNDQEVCFSFEALAALALVGPPFGASSSR